MDIMFKRIIRIFERVAAARAASELARQGYHEQAKRIMAELNS
jgi:hypothetical protein